MPDRHPVDVLSEEHRVIESVLDAFEQELEGMDGTAAFHQEFLSDALEFFSGFADSCHHAKEEDLLFPALERAGMPVQGGPVGCMLHEHEISRGLLRSVRDSIPLAARGDVAARKAIQRHGLLYVDLLRKHIAKEDNILFQMAKGMLSDETSVAMLARFYDEGNDKTNAAARQHFKLLAQRLALTSVSLS